MLTPTASARCRSRSAGGGTTARSCTRSATWAPSRRALPHPRGGAVGVRGPFGDVAARRGDGRRRRHPRRRARSRASAARSRGPAGPARVVRPTAAPLRSADARRPPLSGAARAVGEQGFEVHLTVDSADALVARAGRLRLRAAKDGDVRPDSAVGLVCGPEVMMRVSVAALLERGVTADRTYVSLERSMSCGIGHCGHCQLGPILVCRDGPVFPWDRGARLARGEGALSGAAADTRRLEVQLLRRLPAEPARRRGRAARDCGPRRDRALPRGLERDGRRPVRHLARRRLDHDCPRRRERIQEVRAASACSSRSGPAPRPAASRRSATTRTSRTTSPRSTRRPEYISTLATSTPIADHVDVDFELRGCPINKHQLLEVDLGDAAAAGGRTSPTHSVCVECKSRGIPCVMVSHGIPCLGPVTQAGCGALCPAYNRGCFGCFGPTETPNLASLEAWWAEPRRRRAGPAARALDV